MLIYHPAFDLNHCSYRLLQLLYHMKLSEVEIERIQIWDFYYVFPSEVIANFKFTAETRELKKLFKVVPNPYEDITDPKSVFTRMKPYQSLALKSLASHGLIVHDKLENGTVELVSEKIPEALLNEIKVVTTAQDNIIKLITSPFNELPLFGSEGFKSRTGLLDFKYDRK